MKSRVQASLCYQGAEALVYRTTFPIAQQSSSLTNEAPAVSTNALDTYPAFLKFRPRKPYRHPTLDAKLTRHRILSEARVLTKLRREGVSVPALFALDWEAGWMIGEWVAGPGTVRAVLEKALPSWVADVEAENDQEGLDTQQKQKAEEVGTRLTALMREIGQEVGRMHEVGVVHGDLTTSNLMLRSKEVQVGLASADEITNDVDATTPSRHDDYLGGKVVIIDFGLAAVSTQGEDRAVDLYVLERAFGTTHPQTESLFQELLLSYGQSYKGARVALKRLDEVRLRGRKKIMIG